MSDEWIKKELNMGKSYGDLVYKIEKKYKVTTSDAQAILDAIMED